MEKLTKFGKFIDDLREKLKNHDPDFTIEFESDEHFGDKMTLTYPQYGTTKFVTDISRIGDINYNNNLYNELLKNKVDNMMTFLKFRKNGK